MNREILFKAKRKDNGEWVEGYYLNIAKINHFICTGKIKLDGALKGIIAPEMYVIDPDTLCQYTELTDKNGNRIWENDICKITSDTLDGYEYFICKYESENARYVFEHNNIIIEFGDIYPYEIETVGNIFDNTDLLEVE